jgi:hypothetical protein
MTASQQYQSTLATRSLNIATNIATKAQSRLSSLHSNLQSLNRSASNGTLATAQPLGSFPGGKATVKDTVGQGNPTDFMQIDLTENSRIRLVLNNRSQTRLTAALLNATGAVANVRNGRQILAVTGGQKGETLFTGVKPGTYYLRIKSPASGSNSYEANLFFNRTGGPAPLPCDCGI